MENILHICQEAADMTASQRPDDLFERNVQHNAIMLAVAKNTLDSLLRFGDWQVCLKEAAFSTVSNQTFYPFDQIVPDFYALIHNTIYVKDNAEKVVGALSAEEWMQHKYVSCHTVDVSFRIENNGIRFLKRPPAGVKVVFMYRSNAVCYDAKTFEPKSSIEKNTDIPLFDVYLVKLGIIWRFLKRNGMDYEQEYLEYQKELKKKFGLEISAKDINLAGSLLHLSDKNAVQIALKEVQ